MFDAGWLVHIATAILLLGYFIRDEFWLRMMIIAATAVFNLYYWLVPDPPLWDSVIGGFLMIAVNLFVLAQVVLDRTTFRLSETEKRLFSAFETLSPGQFRRVLKLAQWREAGGEELTRQGEAAGSLYYVFDGLIEGAIFGPPISRPEKYAPTSTATMGATKIRTTPTGP